MAISGEVIHDLVQFTQNLGKHEDILTGMLASLLKHDKSFRNRVLREFLGEGYTSEIGKWATKRKKGFYCETGVVVSKKFFRWYRGPKFKPDIWLYDESVTDKEWKEGPSRGINILIEAKIDMPLSKPQRQGYPEMGRELNSRGCDTSLIIISRLPSTEPGFGSPITWDRIREVVTTLERNVGEHKDDYRFFKQLIDDALNPRIAGLDGPKLLHEVLSWMGRQLVRRGRIIIDSNHPDNWDEKKKKKWLFLVEKKINGIDQSLWLAASLHSKSTLRFRCEQWEQTPNGKWKDLNDPSEEMSALLKKENKMDGDELGNLFRLVAKEMKQFNPLEQITVETKSR